jgi:4,4'-diaponeurosporenoate glycosyltransferase
LSTARIALEVARWAAGWWLLWRVPVPAQPAAPPSERRVSIVIPARNEAATIANLLSSLASMDAEVIVVDDDSDDGTADVARHAAPSAIVVAAAPLPDGWTGKAWACSTGAARATGDVVVFLDADTAFEPQGGLDRVIAEHDRRGGLVSVQPYHVTERPFEWLSAYFNVIAMMGVDAFTPLGSRRRPTGAFGPCMVVDRALYEEFGGHASAPGDVLDDVALARAVQRSGRPVSLFGGRGVVRFRMYPDGVGQLIEGWTKNFAGGAAGTRPLTTLLVMAWLSGAIVATGGPVLLRPPLAAAIGMYAAYAVQLFVLLRRVGRFGALTSILYPIALWLFLAVFVRSAVLTFLRREVRWRGRSIRIR